jgi:type II secretory pathway component PulF
MNKERYSLSMIEAMDENTMRQILKNQEIECMRVDEAARRAAHMEEQARLAEEADKQFLTDFMKEKFRNQGVIIEE